MSEDATQQLLIAHVNRLISIVEPISGHLDNLEKQVIKLEKHFSEKLDNFERQVNERLDNFERQVNERLDNFEKQQAEFSARLDHFEKQQAEFSAKLDHFEKQQAEFSARLESLETKVDQRLHDTRPIWENVQTQLSDLRRESAQFRSETSSGFRAVDRKIGALSKNLVDMTAEMQELREMVEKLDAQPA